MNFTTPASAPLPAVISPDTRSRPVRTRNPAGNSGVSDQMARLPEGMVNSKDRFSFGSSSMTGRGVTAVSASAARRRSSIHAFRDSAAVSGSFPLPKRKRGPPFNFSVRFAALP